MDDYVADQVLRWYERLERGVLEFAEKVPLTQENENLRAPFLATILIDSCSLLDSIFRSRTPESVKIGEKVKNRDECKIPDFAALHAQTLDLPNTRSLMLVAPPSLRSPFKPWQVLTSESEYIPLSWWQCSNDLKHDCVSNLDKATLRVTLDSLCALHQVISRQVEMVPYLLRRGWFSTGQYPVDYIIKDLAQNGLPDVFVVQTKLFAVPIGKARGSSAAESQFPEDLKDLQIWRYQCKRELLDFLPDCL